MSDVSKEYGAAIFALAYESGELESYFAALQRIEAVFIEEPEYEAFLSSPGISMSDRLEAIVAAFGENTPEHVLSYLMLLCEKGRINCFLSSVKEFYALYDASKRIIVAKVTSAVPLTDGEKAKLIAKLEEYYKGKVSGEYFVDESLLGGIIVEADGKIMDGSLRNRLREVKEVMET